MKRDVWYYILKRSREQERRKLEEARKNRKLGELGFLVGAAIAAENDESDFGIICGGVLGFFGAAIFNYAFPDSANRVKRIL